MKKIVGFIIIFLVLLTNLVFATIADRFVYPVLADGHDIGHNNDDPRKHGWFTSGNDFGNYFPDNPVCPDKPYHPGEDWNRYDDRDNLGDENVYSIGAGKIVRIVRDNDFYGDAILIRYELPYEENFERYFIKGTTTQEKYKNSKHITAMWMHIRVDSNLQELEDVILGQPIGTILSEYGHLHFEIMVDPDPAWPSTARNLCGYYESEQDLSYWGYINPSAFIQNHVSSFAGSGNKKAKLGPCVRECIQQYNPSLADSGADEFTIDGPFAQQCVDYCKEGVYYGSCYAFDDGCCNTEYESSDPDCQGGTCIAFDKNYDGPGGSERGSSVQQTSDGGYIVTGDTYYSYLPDEDRHYDLSLIKTDSIGDEEWSRAFDKSYMDRGKSVQQTSDGGYIVVGFTSHLVTGLNDLWLIKTDSNGNMLWENTFGTSNAVDAGFDVQQTSDGGYIVVGGTWSYGAGRVDVWLIKTDANGNMEWDRTYGGSGDEVGYSVQQTSDGGYIVLGYTESDAWLIKTDANGNMQWEKTFGGTNTDYGYSVQQTSDGGYIFVGVTFTYATGNLDDVWLVKTDANGNMQWEKTFGTANEYEAGYDVQQTSDGGYIIAGFTTSFGAGLSDAWLIKTDANGNMEWDRTFGGTNWDRGDSVQQTSDGGYIVAGYTRSMPIPASDDIWLIKVPPDSGCEN